MNNFIGILGLAAMLLFTGASCKKDNPSPEGPDDADKETHHPFLIVTKDQFPALRAKADAEPWKSMKEDAINRANTSSVSSDAYQLQEYIGAVALAYILDTINKQSYAQRVKDAIINKYTTLVIDESQNWGGVVKPLGSFFSAILALDIVYDDLSYADILVCEDAIRNQIFKAKREGSWKTVRYGTHGAWDIYKGDRTGPDDDYHDAILWQITPDGVSPVTNHYAWERVGGGNSRVSKSGYMDVLEFTGIDQRYYNNERIQKFQKWLFGSSINCAKEMAIFGDMLPNQGIGNYMLLRRVVNFDMEAAGYAAWYLEGQPAIGHMLTYILPKQALPNPVIPSSKIYENGGAFFREVPDDPKGLQGVLYNIQTQDEWHTHNEVNGLALSGLGNRLLVNGGRLGSPVRAADLNNTLTLNGENHQSRLGDGIVAGFTAEGLDLGIGDAGPSLGNRTHYRNLAMIHSTNEAQGYFLVYDEVAAGSSDQVKNYLHPANETTVQQVSAMEEYTAPIDHYPTVNGASVSFYYITPPKEVNIDKSKGAVPDRYPGYPDHSRLESVYDTDDAGFVDFATLIFPHDQMHAKANFQRLSGDGFNGCDVVQGNVMDRILETTSEDTITSGELKFRGGLCMAREVAGQTGFYLLRNGRYFSTTGVSMESDDPITIYVNGTKGALFTSGTKLRLSGAGIGQVQFEPAATVLDSGTDFIEVQLADGSYTFQ